FCSMIVFFHCNSYAFSYEIKRFPFRLLKNDETLFSKISTYEKHDNLTIDAKNSTDEQDESDSKSNKELSIDVQKNYSMNKYLRATIETTALLGFISLYYWGTKRFAADFDYDVSFETLKKKFSGKAILFDDNTLEENSFPGHPLAGAYYYLIARNNNLSRTEYFLWTVDTLGRPNRLSAVDRFLDSKCQSRFSDVRWRHIFNENMFIQGCELRGILISTTL